MIRNEDLVQVINPESDFLWEVGTVIDFFEDGLSVAYLVRMNHFDNAEIWFHEDDVERVTG